MHPKSVKKIMSKLNGMTNDGLIEFLDFIEDLKSQMKSNANQKLYHKTISKKQIVEIDRQVAYYKKHPDDYFSWSDLEKYILLKLEDIKEGFLKGLAMKTVKKIKSVIKQLSQKELGRLGLFLEKQVRFRGCPQLKENSPLSEKEIELLSNKIQDEADCLHDLGTFTPKKIDNAVKEHKSKKKEDNLKGKE